MLRLPVSNLPKQSFSFAVDGTTYGITLLYNTIDSNWFMDFAVNDKPLITGRRVVHGVNLVNGYQGCIIFALNASGNDTPITYDSLIAGNTRLYYTTLAELAA